MIEIRNLTKIYKSKKRKKTIAVDNLSLVLPDQGLVFIVGKSGSGKSTLLNMLAGFDDVTKGEIIIDGNRISHFSQSKLNVYHSAHVGFIFQDYHLIDELTVAQNIELALDLIRNNDKTIVPEVLAKVDLEGYENRYPRELSGGQCQRVAIARAIAKNPKIIFGDEPTGNLDNKTSPQILDLLKDLSKEKLVIIVSHNPRDAEKYADRIIELADGRVVKDITRTSEYENEFKIENNTLYLPHYRTLEESEKRKIKRNKDKISKVVQIDAGFEETKNQKSTVNKVKFKSKRISHRSIFKLIKLFLRRKPLNKLLNILLASIIISVFYVFQSFSQFNENNTLALQVIEKKEAAVVVNRKGNLGTIAPGEIEVFQDSYNGEIYKLYCNKMTIKIGSPKETLGSVTTLTPSFFLSQTFGVLNTDLNLLVEKYGVNGSLNILAGEILYDHSEIITDYLADSIMFYEKGKYLTYDDLLINYKGHQICAVIDTGYKQRYKDIFDIYKNVILDPVNAVGIDKTALEKVNYVDFLEEVRKFLGVTYNFSDDYIQELLNSNIITSPYISTIFYSSDSQYEKYNGANNFYISCDSKNTYLLGDDDVVMGFSAYNTLFGTKYTKSNYQEFVPHSITVSKYSSTDKKYCVYSKTFNIKSLAYSSNAFIINENSYADLFKIAFTPLGLYFDDIKQINTVANTATSLGFQLTNVDVSAISYINRAIEIFGVFVDILAILMLVVCVVYLISYGVKNIRKNIYEIGVIKSLGGRTRDISRVFVVESIIVGIGIVFVSIFMMYFVSLVANQILVESLQDMFNIKIRGFAVVAYYPNLVFVDLILALFIVFISSYTPVLVLRRFKPITILKAKE